MLEVFDQPNSKNSCERRDESTVTPQVFALFNSRSSHKRSLAMAARLTRERDTLQAQIERAFRLAFGRRPSEAEIKRSAEHVKELTAWHREHEPPETEPPQTIVRTMVEEMTGLTFRWEEQLDIYQNYVPDRQPSQVDARTRALADFCLVLLNSNEFVYVY